MPATRNFAGVLGALGFAAGLVTLATAARADECSGILCMFQSRPEAPQPPPVVTTPSTTGPVADDTTAPTMPKPKAKPRPVSVVTIAAEPSEVARLKALAAILPKPRVRIVDAKAAGAAADFTVTTAPNGQGAARLFTEQLHVVAAVKVTALADLQGKAVSFGVEGSAGQAAGRKAFEAQGVHVVETPLELDNALDGLASGDIAAVVVLAPQPDARLAKVKGGGLHLVAWPPAAMLPNGTVAATIEGGAYPGLAKAGERIAAIGVDAVLAAGPKAKKQPAAQAFLGALAQHSAALSKRGFDLIRADGETRAARHLADAASH